MAEDHAFYHADFLLECRRCHFVSRDSVADNPQAACAHCGLPGVRFMFPDFVPSALLELVMHYSTQADKRRGARLETLVRDVEARIGVRYEPSVLLAARQHAVQLYNQAGEQSWTEETYQSMVDAIAVDLGLEDDEAAADVYPTVLFYRDDIEENVALVIVASTLLESMLSHLLVAMKMRDGTDEDSADEEVDKLRGFGTRSNDRSSYLNYFLALASVSFAEALDTVGEPTYFAEWANLRDYRNDIVHGRVPQAPGEIANVARQLALRSTLVFAELQNRYALLLPPHR